MPTLHERKEDIPLFVEHFIKHFSKQYAIHPPKLAKSAVTKLYEHPWPGNIRELRNVVNRILLHSLDSSVTETFVADTLHMWDESSREGKNLLPVKEKPETSSFGTLAENEKAHILEALRQSGWRISGHNGAAELLGLPRSTLQGKMRKLGITRNKSQ